MSYYTDKTVLVTGATGLIGSNLVKRLMKTNRIRVIANSRNLEKLQALYSDYLENPLFSCFAHDVSIPFKIEDYQVDIIFHAASPQENKIIKDSPMNVILPNLLGTINCLDLLKKQEIETGAKGRLILFSSITVYANYLENDLVVNEEETAVTDKIGNDSAPYSQSKRMSEVIANAYSKQYNIDIVIARLSTVYGNSIYKTETAFFEFIQNAVSGKNITVNNPLTARRDNIYIEDALNALLLLCEKGASGDVYNISSNKELGNFASVYEIAEKIVNISNEYRKDKKQSEIELISPHMGSPKKRLPGLILDNSKMKSLGWALKTSLDDGLKITIKQNL